MKTQYYTASTLNGFPADERGSLDWLLGLGEVDGMQDGYARFIAAVGAIAMGAHTYEWLLRHEGLLRAPTKWPYAAPTWVFSHRDLPLVPDADLRLVRGDVPAVHAAMMRAAGGKNIWLVGGGELVGSFYDHGLLDEIVVTIAPIVLPSGAPILPRRITDPPLAPTGVERHGDVFVTLTYGVAPGVAREPSLPVRSPGA
jgi:dihydrofolate reductase